LKLVASARGVLARDDGVATNLCIVGSDVQPIDIAAQVLQHLFDAGQSLLVGVPVERQGAASLRPAALKMPIKGDGQSAVTVRSGRPLRSAAGARRSTPSRSAGCS